MVWCVLCTPANEYVDDLEENFFFRSFSLEQQQRQQQKVGEIAYICIFASC